ncbi:MAG TPA: TolC family protein, partial [Isosphaeraceae bacterium]|nr:TolC family protein [Isosphaeraceae bacterium]
HYVANVKRFADGPPLQATKVGFKPEVKSIKDGVTAHLSGRPIDQGVLTQVFLDETRLQALYDVTVADGVKGRAPGEGPTRLDARYQVPDVVDSKVEGEWLIPKDGALLISLGVHPEPEGFSTSKTFFSRLAGPPAVRERLVMIVARTSDQAEAAPDLSKAAWHAAPAPQAALPARVAPIPNGAVPPDLMLGDAAPAGIAALPTPPTPPVPPAPPLPAPVPPARSLPQGYTPDGKAADLPPIFPEEPAPSPSAEPQPSPQGRPQATAPAEAELERRAEEWRASFEACDPMFLARSRWPSSGSLPAQPQAAAPAAPACDRLAQLMDHGRQAERDGKYAEAEACAREAMVIDPNDLAAAAFAWKMRLMRHAKDDRPVVRTAIMTTPDAAPSCCDCCAQGKPCEPKKSAKAETRVTPDPGAVLRSIEEAFATVGSTLGAVPAPTNVRLVKPAPNCCPDAKATPAAPTKKANEDKSMSYEEYRKTATPEDRREVERVIALGAHGIETGVFESTPIATAAGGALGQGSLTTVYDPTIQGPPIVTLPVVPGLPEHPLPKLAERCESACEDGREVCPLTLKEAIRIGLENSEVVRVVTIEAAGKNVPSEIGGKLPSGSPQDPARKGAESGPIVIARLNTDTAIWTFKTAVQEEVRAIEQQYWALSGQYVRRWACGVAVRVAEEAYRREQARLEAGHATADALAAAKERLERARLDLVTSMADIKTTERQLRNMLGLKPTDGRRIVPVTAPAESHAELKWDECLSVMMAHHPEIGRNELLVRADELQLRMAREQILPAEYRKALDQFSGAGHLLDEASAAQGLRRLTEGQAESKLCRQQALLQQVKHKTTHALARFFLEVDANAKQFATAGRLRAAAQENLQAKWARYEEGEVPVVDVLDAVDRWARDTAMEAQYRTSYNIALVAVEEAKGTLLEYKGINVLESPQPRKAYIQARDADKGHFQIRIRTVKIPVRPAEGNPVRYRVIQVPVGPAPKADAEAVPTSAEVPADPVKASDFEARDASFALPLGGSATVQVRVRVWKAPVAK